MAPRDNGTGKDEDDLRLKEVLAKIDKAMEEGGVGLDLETLNGKFALVIVGGTAAIMKTDKPSPDFWTISTFTQWLSNQPPVLIIRDRRGRSRIGTAEEAKEGIKVDGDKWFWTPLAKYWLTSPKRRQYEGVVFAPGREVPKHYNLWRGLAVEAKPGNCGKFLAHLKDNVANGDPDHYNWIVGWFAQIVQKPAEKMGTSLVLRGGQGTGKTKVGEVIGSLLGTHYSGPVSDPRYIVGQFNSHMVSLLLLHADEAFWAGDHRAEGRLKDLITGGSQYIEFKGKEPIRVDNHLRTFICGNAAWVVPAGFDERRMAVFDMGTAQMQNKPYFAAIDHEMNNGGREALLHHLLTFDLSTVDLRTVPKTDALLDQKMASLTDLQGWWLDILHRGSLPGSAGGSICPAGGRFTSYIDHSNNMGVRRRSIEVQVGSFLKKAAPGLVKAETKGTSVYRFPALEQCRDNFAAMLGQDMSWSGPKAWRKF